MIRRLDAVSLLGLPAAVGLVVLAQMLEGGHARSLFQPTAMLVVFGGTCAAVAVNYPLRAIRLTARAVAGAFGAPDDDVEAVVRRFVGYAFDARRRGVVALEPEIERTGDPFLKKALSLAVDGVDAKAARAILDIEHTAAGAEADTPADVLETAAGYTPTLGILGAVLGLIHVMERLTEPSALGSGVAVAFVSTVYGVGAANLILLPLAGRLRGCARAAALRRDVIVEGVVALQEGLNPRLTELKLRGFVNAA